MRNILEVNNLCKTYMINKNENKVLKNVDLEIKEGEFVSIMGPSGSGKSTLLYNISGMDKMTSGQVIFDGEDLSTLTEKQLSKLRLKKMGFVFQQFNLLKNLGITDNIVVSAYMSKEKNRKEINKKALELMKKTGIEDLLDNDINQASGGQLQRAAICRSLINNPKVVFGDEPTGALNSKSSNEVMEIFDDINKEGTTVILVTHDVNVASKTERVIYMIDGKIEGEISLGKYKKEESKQREVELSQWLLNKGW